MKHKSLLTVIATVLSIGATHAADMTQVKHAPYTRDAVIYEVNVRQYTPEGTFDAFAEHLPRLKDLGVDILWFMPIHPISEKNRKGELGSYYAVRDYKDVNPEFGNLDSFKAVVDKAHALGMKVIIDWVPNHTGCDNAWTVTNPDRYALNEKGEMYGPFDWTDTYKLNYANPDTRAAMTDALTFWLREAGIDGFRCDVAGQVPVDFWNEVRPALDAAAPGRQIFMLAEATEPELTEQCFDMVYGWPMKDLFTKVAKGDVKATDIYALNTSLGALYPADAYIMNMVTNHDLNSWEGTEFERLGNKVNAFAVLTYTLPGMPLIYTGQEVGMNRAFKFFEKDQAPDFTANDYTAFYKQLNALRHSRTELASGTHGGVMSAYNTGNDNVLAYERRLGDKATITIVNLGNDDAQLAIASLDLTGAKNALTGEVAVLPATLKSGEYLIYTIN